MAETTPPPVTPCVVCKGCLEPDVTQEYDPMTGPVVIGPASKRQFRDVQHGYYCTGCGIKYKHPPKRPPPETFPRAGD